MQYFKLFSVLSLAVLTGCQSLQPQADKPVQASVKLKEVKPLPFATPQKPAIELDEELLYNYLVAELGAKRGVFTTSLAAYEKAAQSAQDAYAAEKATRIALHVKDYMTARRTVQQWIDYAPNDIGARKLAVLLFIQNGDMDRAEQQVNAIYEIAQATDGQPFLQIAGALMGAEDISSAIDLMQVLLQQHKDKAEAYFALAMLQSRNSGYSDAELALRQAIAIKPEWSEPYVLLVQVLKAQGSADTAIDDFAEAVQQYPNVTVLRSAYARMLVDAENYPAALLQFRELLRQSPEDGAVMFGLAMLETQENNLSEARELWLELLEDEKRFEDASYYLAQIEERSDNFSRAIELYGNVQDGGLQVDAIIRKAKLQAVHETLAEARETLSDARLLHVDRIIDLYIAETQLLQEAKEQALALTVYEEALSAYPDENVLLYNRGIYAAELERFDWLERDMNAVLANDENNVDALNALGYTLADRGERLADALDMISRALALRPDNAAILDSMGWVHYRLKDYPKAIDYLQKALIDRQDSEIAAHLGEVLWVSGEREAAVKVWQKALAEDPTSAVLQAVMKKFVVES